MSIPVTNIEASIRFARAYCANKLPWFAPALFHCRIHIDERVPIAAVDYHFNVYFNPKAILEIEKSGTREEQMAQIGFLWIHEICHVLREHGERAKERKAKPFIWNVAADLEINDGKWKGLTMPKAFPGMHPHQYKWQTGQLAEFYYKKLINSNDEELQRFLKEGYRTLNEGSGVHGQPCEWEVDSSGQKQELNPIETEVIRRSVAKEMKANKAMGSMPGGWGRWVEEKLAGKVDWRQVLRHRMSVAISTGVGSRIDYNFQRPNRRQSIYSPFLLPTLGGNMSARVSCVVDTSGSMTGEQMGQAVGEVLGVLQAFQVPVTVIPCDARAYEPIKIAAPSDYFKLKQLPGGGGTNMIVGIDAALKLKPQPDTVLVLTDGYTPYPAKLYKVPVVFGILNMKTYAPKYPPNPPWKKDKVVTIDL